MPILIIIVLEPAPRHWLFPIPIKIVVLALIVLALVLAMAGSVNAQDTELFYFAPMLLKPQFSNAEQIAEAWLTDLKKKAALSAFLLASQPDSCQTSDDRWDDSKMCLWYVGNAGGSSCMLAVMPESVSKVLVIHERDRNQVSLVSDMGWDDQEEWAVITVRDPGQYSVWLANTFNYELTNLGSFTIEGDECL